MPQSYLEVVKRYYKTAEHADLMWREALIHLENIGISPDKTMTANSVCSDDVTAMQFPIPNNGLLGPFYMGGLDGFPFTGLTGMQAFAHHMPKDGALLVYYGPHIGITREGEIGKVRRRGQDHPSDCCGAACAAMKRLDEQPRQPTVLDYQQDNIATLFQLNRIEIGNKENIQGATQVMYDAIEKRIELLIAESRHTFKGKLIQLGSIFINVDDGAEACVTYPTFKITDLATNEVTDHLKGFKAHIASLRK